MVCNIVDQHVGHLFIGYQSKERKITSIWVTSIEEWRSLNSFSYIMFDKWILVPNTNNVHLHIYNATTMSNKLQSIFTCWVLLLVLVLFIYNIAITNCCITYTFLVIIGFIIVMQWSCKGTIFGKASFNFWYFKYFFLVHIW